MTFQPHADFNAAGETTGAAALCAYFANLDENLQDMTQFESRWLSLAHTACSRQELAKIMNGCHYAAEKLGPEARKVIRECLQAHTQILFDAMQPHFYTLKTHEMRLIFQACNTFQITLPDKILHKLDQQLIKNAPLTHANETASLLREYSNTGVIPSMETLTASLNAIVAQIPASIPARHLPYIASDVLMAYARFAMAPSGPMLDVIKTAITHPGISYTAKRYANTLWFLAMIDAATQSEIPAIHQLATLCAQHMMSKYNATPISNMLYPMDQRRLRDAGLWFWYKSIPCVPKAHYDLYPQWKIDFFALFNDRSAFQSVDPSLDHMDRITDLALAGPKAVTYIQADSDMHFMHDYSQGQWRYKGVIHLQTRLIRALHPGSTILRMPALEYRRGHDALKHNFGAAMRAAVHGAVTSPARACEIRYDAGAMVLRPFGLETFPVFSAS